MLNFKDINNKVMDICKNTSKMFSAICQKFKIMNKVRKSRVEKKWEL